jgi:hypothetical protein
LASAILAPAAMNTALAMAEVVPIYRPRRRRLPEASLTPGSAREAPGLEGVMYFWGGLVQIERHDSPQVLSV